MIKLPDHESEEAAQILIDKIGEEELKNLLMKLLAVDKLTEADLSSKYLDSPAAFLLTYFGTDLLHQKSIRMALVSSLLGSSRNSVIRLYRKLGYENRPTNNDSKLVEISALKSWRSGSNKSIEFTRFFGFPEKYSGIKKEGNKLEPYEEVKAAEKWNKLHDYQLILLDKMDDWYGNVSQTSSGMLVMPTGTGKTRVAASLIINNMRRAYESSNRINYSVLWIAHTKELIEQAYETFRKMWVNEGSQGRTLKLTRFYDEIDAGELLDNWGIIVSSIQKIHESIKEESSPSSRIIKNRLAPNLRLVVIDEAHLAENPSYKEVLNFLSKNSTFESQLDNGWKLLGLTATPFKSDEKRTEKLNKMFSQRFQLSKKDDLPEIEKYGVYDWFKKKRYMSHDVRYIPLSLPEKIFTLKGNERKHFKRFQSLHKTTLARLALNDSRNEYIIKEIKRAISEGSRKILLFSCSVPHCYLLHALLNSEGIESNFVIGQMSRRERDENINSFRNNKDKPIVLINYAILTTGFDDPEIDTVVITRPTGSRVLYHQMIGRGLRGEKNGGNKGGVCRIYDVKDNFDEFEGFNVIDYDKEISEMSDY